MLSMCGIICRVFRGWRQNEAAQLMETAVAQSCVSLLIEDRRPNIGLPTSEKDPVNTPRQASSFCRQSSTEEEVRCQLLWCDNNKQASIVIPKQIIDLKRWTLFLSSNSPSDSKEACSIPSGSCDTLCSTSSNGEIPAPTQVIRDDDQIIVLLEATFRESDEESLYGYYVTVEQLAQPYAWKARETFGIIVRISRDRLITMIDAFFNNALLIDDDLCIRKILTVDIMGEPSTLDDPSTISESRTPGPWSGPVTERNLLEIARCLSPTSDLRKQSSSSNPNLFGGAGSFIHRGMSQSSSFTSSPFRRPHSSAGIFSPAKRGFSSIPGTPLLCSSMNPCDSAPASPLIEEEEELEPCRKNLDQIDDKPPNILIYAANKQDYYNTIRETLCQCVNPERYLIYQLTNEIAFKPQWSSNTTLLVVCGDVPTHISTSFIRYLLNGGRILSICSDFLSVAVPLYAGTKEIQEESVVSVSYRKWNSVQLLHHQHCFHSSPTHKRFSKDIDEAMQPNSNKSTVSVEPTHVEITDELGGHHRLDLNILAKEDTWGAPSLLCASATGGGKAIFSQVHLEQDPSQYLEKMTNLSSSNKARLEILKDLLTSELGLDSMNSNRRPTQFYPAYFLGRHDVKKDIIKKLEPFLKGESGRELVRPDLTLQFFESDEVMNMPTEKYLPIYMNSCPNTFSTLRYYETLTTRSIGRVVIYCDVVASTMKVTGGHPPISHGVAVVATQQVSGKGRGGNAWLSPLGCAMFTVQIHIPLASSLGQKISFIQHLICIAVAKSIRELPGYANVPLNIKWPNDIYAGNTTKIGGIVTEATTFKGEVVVNAGCGVNLSNSNPTTCINDLINDYNFNNGTMLPEIERETYLARVFNCIEKLIDDYQLKGPQEVIDQYYNYWLHGDAEVIVQNESHQKADAVITGIDEFGFLQARLNNGQNISLDSDGNSFDMMDGLVYSKIR